MSRPTLTRIPARTAAVVATWLAIGTACLPTQASLRQIEVRIGAEHPGGLAIVHLPIPKLQELIEDYDAKTAAYYFRGREPLAHALEDTDADGVVDRVILKIPSAGDRHWIIVVCPGPATGSELPVGGSARGVRVMLQ